MSTNIDCRIGNYEVVLSQDGTYLICRVGDGLEWSRAADRMAARKDAQIATSGFDRWRQSTRGTGLLPTDFGRMVNLGNEYRRIIDFVPTAKEQKVITERKNKVVAYSVEEVLRALPKAR